MPSPRSILIVEDDESWLDFCVTMLVKEGFQVAAVSKGADALPKLKAQAFDIVLTDHVAPGAQWGSMIEAVKVISPGTEVIAMTARPSVEDSAAAFKQGAGDYLAKPFTIERLRAAVDACLQNKRNHGVAGLDLLGDLIEEKLLKIMSSSRPGLAKPEVVSALNRMLVDFKSRLPAEYTQPLYDPSSNRLSGQTLGRYEIIKELGRGAMGLVYLGRDPRINRLVALKTFAPTGEAGEGKKRFYREAECAGRLAHPNIVKIFDVGEEGGDAFIAMEFLEGRDLRALTEPADLLPCEQALEYVRQAALALDYAHSQGVVHRDIKPANLMIVEKDKSLRITDFGIACLSDAAEETMGVVGTPYYMSPERVAGAKVDGRADLFSLGVVLFELLTGERPWQNKASIPAVLYEVANEPHRSLLSVRPEFPAKLSAVIDKALSKSRETRYQSGAELAADLSGLCR